MTEGMSIPHSLFNVSLDVGVAASLPPPRGGPIIKKGSVGLAFFF